ncbi:thioesterase superfamily protein [Tamaricihabitans halophyticus]|uniref:Acyl-coenzyme A thioesterase THEM4 n=1 Tax=Tamaricihabitans halophyticus TaxID=1262583 RepID=A0A4R2QN82_9PSEU|nr:PaaI family thioesterase [Tamaricihabitans halophyticus]TCP50058.1 thioesterase superfamily protein [Tamaricihabitans halophyticus]
MTQQEDQQEELAERRAAVAELGAAVRALTDAAVVSEVDDATLRSVAAAVAELVPSLTAARRERHERPATDPPGSGHRWYNPVIGAGNPMAPPVHVELVDGRAVGTCVLGLAYEGPRGYVHGGISALLLDQILGHAHGASGRPGMTISLSLRYRGPVPLNTPLRITGWLGESDPGRPSDADDHGDDRQPSHAIGTISTADEPDSVLVEARGKFIVPNRKQVQRIFGGEDFAR